MAGLANFRLHLTPDPSETRVFVDEIEIRGLLGVQIAKAEPTDLPVVSLLVQAGSIDVSGTGNNAVTLGQTAADFLDEVDAKELSAQALAMGSYSQDPVATAIEILKARANGAT